MMYHVAYSFITILDVGILRASLPARYGRYDLYHSYKVVVNDRDPWLRNSYYRSHYADLTADVISL